MSTRRQPRPGAATAPDARPESEAPSTTPVPPPFVYPLDDIDIEVDMHRHPNSPASLVRSAGIVFKHGVLAGLKLHGFSVWCDARHDERKVRWPARDLYPAGNGFKRAWTLLRGVTPNDFTPHKRLDQVILDAVDAAPPVSATIG